MYTDDVDFNQNKEHWLPFCGSYQYEDQTVLAGRPQLWRAVETEKVDLLHVWATRRPRAIVPYGGLFYVG